MEAIKLRSHVGPDGILRVDVPVGIADTDLEVLVVDQPVGLNGKALTPEELGWSPGFFEKTNGCLRDTPIERPPQGEFEEREPLE
ncbi:MAG: hypothetical protein HY321_01590 [Armatimonadetes bacterium]|nr:hypothetical protein [Armatimonadota bacterium]